MQFSEAATFLSALKFTNTHPQHWADLGCGKGFFTEVLAGMLPQHSSIAAVDAAPQLLKPVAGNNVQIQFIKANFDTGVLPLQNLDGILMANALHYVQDKKSLIIKLKQWLKKDGMLLVIEYDTLSANKWVPYPINFATLQQIFAKAGFINITKIGERNSIYNANKMYACTMNL